MKHFIYTKTVRKNIPVPEGKEGETVTEVITLRESFNMEKVIRSVMKDEKTLVVLLDDGHEESIELAPEHRNAQGKKVEAVKKRLFLASEIELTGDDIDRFFNYINPPVYD